MVTTGYRTTIGASLLALALATPALAQQPPAPAQPAGGASLALPDIIVTAQKREQALSDVGMSINVQTGDQLAKLGITDTASLSKVTPGLSFNPGQYGVPVYTIRGIGFQDTSLAASPTVSTYVDQVPLPFSVMTVGAALDVQRVEVLKGPQGILFGENSTGGAINYIANKPTDDLAMGFNASYGRFSQFDFEGYVSGPLTDTLKARVAIRRMSMGDWQQGFTTPSTTGQQNVSMGRILVDWEPSSRFRASLNVNGWLDKSDTQAPQVFGMYQHNPATPLDPRLIAYPMAPHNNRAADRSVCVNVSPLNEPYNDVQPPYMYDPERPDHPTDCAGLARDNKFFSASLRLDYDLSDAVTLTSISAYMHLKRWQPTDSDGITYQDFDTLQQGSIDTLYQELRLSGNFGDGGNWIVGGNFERDKTWDQFQHSLGNSTSTPVLGIMVNGARPWNRQNAKTYAAFGNIEYPVTDTVSVHAGARYTKVNRSYIGCANDTGDGGWANVSKVMQNIFALANGLITQAEFDAGMGPGVRVPDGACATVGLAPDFNPQQPGFTKELNQGNFSFRAGLDWKVTPDAMIYANISRGFKAGGFSTFATSIFEQLVPAVQERLTAYEAGFKTSLLEHQLQLDGAVFYYDYKDKQILGNIQDVVFGAEPALVNIPKSRVIGFELSATARPTDGLTIQSGVSYAKSKVTADYFDLTPFSTERVNYKGQPFPASPPWQAFGDVQYEFPLAGEVSGFVGANANYQSSTIQFFYDAGPTPAMPRDTLEVPSRLLVDLRAGIEAGQWRVQAYVRNLTDKWYWNSANAVNDTLVRYTGLPRTYGLSVSWKY